MTEPQPQPHASPLVTFPHMGTSYIPIKVLLESLGLTCIVPPINTPRTLEKSLIQAPEFMCYPFKLILGNLIYGLENGAQTIIFGGSQGPCRQEYYNDVLQSILKDMGYTFSYVTLNLSQLWSRHNYTAVRQAWGVHLGHILKSLALTVDTLFSVDSLSLSARRKRCRTSNKTAVETILHTLTDHVMQAHGHAAITHLVRQAHRHIRALPEEKSPEDILRVAIVGEIFVTSDAFSNLDIERKLGHMGVDVTTYMGPASWVREHLIKALNPFQKTGKAQELSREYWNVDDIGGHGVQTVGNSVLSSRRGYDGIIHLYPLTCMPEIAAQSAFSAIQNRYGVPIMTLVVDEMTGEAGYNTRLEAFVDMIRMRKSRNVNILNVDIPGYKRKQWARNSQKS
ncbi:MAG: hypothetical protein FWG14_13295 [Peptococcaceae bacterium]|nr:hypothetical protein [Peptococcaceae bacterium]